MNKRNNKGFTLVELIIAMSILSIALTLGYKVMNGSEKVTKNQLEVFGEQQDANLVNLYLTKDLEQVRKFTTANTGSNPYTYILNDGVQGVEKIEYEVEKTNDGKFYTVTRKTSGGSIELVSNYSTSSQIPFSISLVENTENLFKVSLDGKFRNNKVSKYEFEVSSRVQNNVALVETPITSGGTTQQPPQEQQPSQPQPPQEQQPSQPQPPQEQQKHVISGEVRYNYTNTTGNGGNLSIIASALKDGNEYANEGKPESFGPKNFSKINSYRIDVDIPINSDKLNIVLSSTSKNTIKEQIFNVSGNTNKWNIFTNEIDNNKIYIYGQNVTIQNIYINGNKKNIIDETYTYDIGKTETSAKVVVDFSTQNGNGKSGFVTIGFGEFSIPTNSK